MDAPERSGLLVDLDSNSSSAARASRERACEILRANGLNNLVTLTDPIGDQIHVPIKVLPPQHLRTLSNENGFQLSMSDLQQLQTLIHQHARQIQMQQTQLCSLLEAQQTILQNASILYDQEKRNHTVLRDQLYQQLLSEQRNYSSVDQSASNQRNYSSVDQSASNQRNYSLLDQSADCRSKPPRSIEINAPSSSSCSSTPPDQKFAFGQSLLNRTKQMSQSHTSLSEPMSQSPSNKVESISQSRPGIAEPMGVEMKVESSENQCVYVPSEEWRNAVCSTKEADQNFPVSSTTLSKSSSEAHMTLPALEEFAKFFKKRRIDLGFNQSDIGLALGRLYGADFSQTTISRFEALNLSYKNMVKLKPLLDRLLVDVDTHGPANVLRIMIATPKEQVEAATTSAPTESAEANTTPECSTRIPACKAEYIRRRRKRTLIGRDYRSAMEQYYKKMRRPGGKQMEIIADKLGLTKEVVRVWFCNRRQRDKKFSPGYTSPSDSSAPGSSIDNPAIILD